MENFELLLSNEHLMAEFICALKDKETPNAAYPIVYNRNTYEVRYSPENGITVEPSTRGCGDDAERMQDILNERL